MPTDLEKYFTERFLGKSLRDIREMTELISICRTWKFEICILSSVVARQERKDRVNVILNPLEEIKQVWVG